jgi:transcription elongation factor SPT6
VQKRQVMARGIQHPNFHNVTAEEAEAMLAAMDRGEAVIRPSASNPNQLSLTWKVQCA